MVISTLSLAGKRPCWYLSPIMTIKSHAKVLLTVGLLFLLPYAAAGQSPGELEGFKRDLLKEIEELKEGQKRIQKELDELTTLIRGRRPRAFQRLTVSFADRPFKGDPNAKLVLLDFTDYQ